MSFLSKLFNSIRDKAKDAGNRAAFETFYDEENMEGEAADIEWDELTPATNESMDEPEEYEIVEREILPQKIICPDCGGITLEGLEFCDKCGGELL